MSETAPDQVKYPRRWTMGGFVYKDDNGDWVPEDTDWDVEVEDDYDWETYVRNARDLIEAEQSVLSDRDDHVEDFWDAKLPPVSDHNPYEGVAAQDVAQEKLDELRERAAELRAKEEHEQYWKDVAKRAEEDFKTAYADESSPREELLDEAKRLIMGDRNNVYGPPGQDFTRSAEAMTAMGYRSATGPIRAHDVAILVMLVKISRLQWSPEKKDSWLDIAGYSGCGWECTRNE